MVPHMKWRPRGRPAFVGRNAGLLLAFLVILCPAGLNALSLPARIPGGDGRCPSPDPGSAALEAGAGFDYSFARTLAEEESGRLSGGDTRMRLNAARTKLSVQVIDNEYEARLGRIPPVETYEIDVHNRVVDTRSAPFMPTPVSARVTSSLGKLTSVPAAFPEGYWTITAVTPREGKFGPSMISTNAVGIVDVYADEGSSYVGSYSDTGYAIHANSNPFESSKSYGCLVARQEDIRKLESTLKADRKKNPRAVQKLLVMDD